MYLTPEIGDELELYLDGRRHFMEVKTVQLSIHDTQEFICYVTDVDDETEEERRWTVAVQGRVCMGSIDSVRWTVRWFSRLP